MDEDLKAYLQQMETRLTVRFDEKLDSVSTRLEKLEALSTRFDEKLETLSTRFDGKLEALSTRFDGKLETLTLSFDEKLETLSSHFDEKLERTETRLLTEFYKWAQANNLRHHRVEESDSNTAKRLTGLEERIFSIEQRLNLGGAKPS